MIEYVAEKRNCFQCCIAGLFELELKVVPDIMEFKLDSEQNGSTNWFDSFYEWCKEYVNHIPVVIMEDDLDDTLDDLLHVCVYENKRNITHATVYKGQELRWDPALGANKPDVIDPIYRILFIPISMPGGISHAE